MPISRFEWYEIVQYGASNRGNIVCLPNGNLSLDYYGEACVDAYHSIYTHTSDYKTYKSPSGSKEGYDGEIDIKYLYFDIDNSDPNIAQRHASLLYDRLVGLGVNPKCIRIYFSGCKGYHVIAPVIEIELIQNNFTLHKVIKSVCESIAANISSFDSRIYDKTRIFRTPNSAHGKTNLYKICLSEHELKHLHGDDLRRLSKQQRKSFEYEAPMENTKLREIIRDAQNRLSEDTKVVSSYTGNQIVDGIINGFGSGNRNTGLTSIAGMLHRRNISDNFIHSIVSLVNNNSDKPLSDREINTIVSSISKYPIDQQYVDPKTDEIMTFADAGKKFFNVRDRFQTVDFGFPHLNQQLPFFDPGDVFLICARAGVGKTTFAMQMHNNLSKAGGGYGLFTSLEMASHFIFLRAACITQNSGEEKYTAYDVSSKLLADRSLANNISKQWERLLIMDKDSLSLERVEQYYTIAKEKYPLLDNLLIDYGGLLKGADDYHGISKIARDLKGLAKRLATRLTVVVQMSRGAGDGTVPVRMDMLRDTGSWEEGADYIYGGWLSSVTPTRIRMKALKNRWLEERGAMFDLINNGLNYTSDVYISDSRLKKEIQDNELTLIGGDGGKW